MKALIPIISLVMASGVLASNVSNVAKDWEPEKRGGVYCRSGSGSYVDQVSDQLNKELATLNLVSISAPTMTTYRISSVEYVSVCISTVSLKR